MTLAWRPVAAAACAVLALVWAGQAAGKPGTPGPDYFTGIYDFIGRSGGGDGQLMDQAAAIVADGQNVIIRRCAAPDIALSFGPAFEIVNLMSGSMANVPVQCLFHNNGYNRPILTCRARDGAAFTLWPATRPADLNC